jgi:hypothetical protein
MSANRSHGYPMMAQPDGHAGSGGVGSSVAPKMSAEEIERRRQIEAILDQGDRDIAAGNGSDWSDVKQRMRERILARTR